MTMQRRRSIVGALFGDIAGRNFECSKWNGKTFETAECIGYDRELWWLDRTGAKAATHNLLDNQTGPTDDSLLTIAIAKWLLDGGDLKNFIKDSVRENPEAGWGAYLKKWAVSDGNEQCNSFGNGGAMRVSPVAYAAQSQGHLLALARDSATVTHTVDHAVAGACAVAQAVFLARKKMAKMRIAEWITGAYDYDLTIPLDDIREGYQFSSKCPDSVPWAIRAFLEADDFEETIRRAISIGGDADTIASMAGAYWGVPEEYYGFAMNMLSSEQREIVIRFDQKFCT